MADHPSNLTRDQINFLIASANTRVQATESHSEPEEEGMTRIVFQQDE